VEFLLECVGFPPETDFEGLARQIEAKGESDPWRGPSGTHKRLPLAGGIELHFDREEGHDFHTLMPQFRVPHRLRVAVSTLTRIPDSPFDALLLGEANPLAPGHRDSYVGQQFWLATCIVDRRRLPQDLPQGHVLAVGTAGFALDVTYCGPNAGASHPEVLELPRGAYLAPLGGDDAPGGCMEVSLRVREIQHVRNPITGVFVEILETDAPGRPLILFVSRWQLEQDGLPAPRPGWRIEGTFLFSGRITGGLPRPPLETQRVFG
jgi:hypothetical protein